MIDFDGMSRPQITAVLSLSVQKYINPNNDPRIYWAREVTFDYATSNAVRVDFMRFKPVNNTVSGIEKGDFYCYEVKSSAEDFHSKNGHNFLGDFNYYIMPEDVFEVTTFAVVWIEIFSPALVWQVRYCQLSTHRIAKYSDRFTNRFCAVRIPA